MSDLTKETIDFLMKNGKSPVIEIGGETFNVRHDNSLIPIEKVKNDAYVIKPLETHTLNSVIDYIKQSIDNYTPKVLLIHIENENTVSIKTDIYYDKRDCVLEARFIEPKRTLNAFMTHESFIIMLSSTFQKDSNLENLLQSIGRVSDNNVKTVSDDGLTQSVTIKKGIELLSEKVIPSIVELTPFRTFSEAEQPKQLFLVRSKKGVDLPEFGLFEADGGAWKNTAIENIKKYLVKNLPSDIRILS